MTNNNFQPHAIPATFADNYTEQNKADIETIVSWLNEHEKARNWLASAACVNKNTFSQVLTGIYPGAVSRFIKSASETIANLDARTAVQDTPFVPTSVSRLLVTACKRARKSQMFAVVATNVGTGKTRTLGDYAAANANTFFIEADPHMNPAAMIDDLLAAFDSRIISEKSANRLKFRAVIAHMEKMATPLIILDEAETVNPNTLEFLRRIRDKAGVGVVLAGTLKLNYLIAPRNSQFDQIRSRVNFYPPAVNAITVDDAKAVLSAAFEDRPELFTDDGDIKKQEFKALWDYCGGSIRVLVEDLIPAIRDYGIPQHGAVTADVIHGVAKNVLSLTA